MLALAARVQAAGPVTVTIPPGWEDVTAQRHRAEVLVALKGPGTSSFMLTRLKRVSFSNRAVIRTLLLDILSGVNRKTGMSFTLASNLKTLVLDNNATAYYIEATLEGKPRLILALLQVDGMTLLATLVSSVPDTLAPGLLGSIRFGPGRGPGAPEAPSRPDAAVSADGQLRFSIIEEAMPVPIPARERAAGKVFALSGLSSALTVVKLDEPSGTPQQEAQAVRETVLAIPGADRRALSAARAIRSAAGPTAIFAEGRLADDPKIEVAAAFLPWCYWGYSIVARGPKASELVRRAIAGLLPGPAADRRLVAATPKLKLRPSLSQPIAALALAALLLYAVLRSFRRTG